MLLFLDPVIQEDTLESRWGLISSPSEPIAQRVFPLGSPILGKGPTDT